jgi:hypothetical protein
MPILVWLTGRSSFVIAEVNLPVVDLSAERFGDGDAIVADVAIVLFGLGDLELAPQFGQLRIDAGPPVRAADRLGACR